MQVETIIEYEPGVNISSLIDKDDLQLITEEIKNGSTSLKELKEKLPAKITFPQIRIALAKFKADSLLSSSDVQHKP